MRFIHTSDWHIGRLFHGLHLTEDQAQVLQQVVDLAKEAKPDAVLVAGDVFDRAVPPPDAVAVLDDILSELVLGLKIPVILIAGNHDSPQRLEFGSKLLSQQGLHLIGNASQTVRTVRLEDQAGAVFVHAVPYAEPSVWRERMEDEGIHDHNTGMQALVRSLKGARPEGTRGILLTHATVMGGEETESERPLCVGGASTVDASCLGEFHYVALGHLHRRQALGEGRIHYPGSLMKYSFSEATHTKGVNLVEMDAHGRCTIEKILLNPRREVRCLKGHMDEILQGPQKGESREDYIHVTLEDKGPILDPIGKVRLVYPNVLAIERAILAVDGGGGGPRVDHRKISETELLSAFFKEATGEAVSEPEIAVYNAVVNQMQQEEREASR